MELKKEIEKCFANIHVDFAIPLEKISKTFPAWVIRLNDEFGVAVPYIGNPINENFANAKIYDTVLVLGGQQTHCLLLTSEIEETRNEFSAFCVDFINPGENGSLREELLRDPFKWWSKWKNLIGNTIVNKRPYAVLGELITYYYLIGKGVNPIWKGPNGASSDIVDDFCNNEVKSTLKRYDKIVTISGQFQLNAENLFLYFCRFEKSEHGISINNMVDKLVIVRQDRRYIDRLLKKLGYGIGNSAREQKFVLHEMLKYPIDCSFPKITPDSFVGGRIPNGIVHIKYDVDLENLKADVINLGFLGLHC